MAETTYRDKADTTTRAGFEVTGTHLGLAFNSKVYEIIAARLGNLVTRQPVGVAAG